MIALETQLDINACIKQELSCSEIARPTVEFDRRRHKAVNPVLALRCGDDGL